MPMSLESKGKVPSPAEIVLGPKTCFAVKKTDDAKTLSTI